MKNGVPIVHMSGVGTVGQVHDEIERELVSRASLRCNEPLISWRKNAATDEKDMRECGKMLATICYGELKNP